MKVCLSGGLWQGERVQGGKKCPWIWKGWLGLERE